MSRFRYTPQASDSNTQAKKSDQTVIEANSEIVLNFFQKKLFSHLHQFRPISSKIQQV